MDKDNFIQKHDMSTNPSSSSSLSSSSSSSSLSGGNTSSDSDYEIKENLKVPVEEKRGTVSGSAAGISVALGFKVPQESPN